MSLECMQIENCRSFVADLKKIFFDLLCRVLLKIKHYINEQIHGIPEVTKLFQAENTALSAEVANNRCSE